MKNSVARWMKNMILLGSAGLCLWCVGGRLQTWAAEKGDDALLFAAGIQAQAASS